jgi:hypothetical protein
MKKKLIKFTIPNYSTIVLSEFLSRRKERRTGGETSLILR